MQEAHSIEAQDNIAADWVAIQSAYDDDAVISHCAFKSFALCGGELHGHAFNIATASGSFWLQMS